MDSFLQKLCDSPVDAEHPFCRSASYALTLLVSEIRPRNPIAENAGSVCSRRRFFYGQTKVELRTKVTEAFFDSLPTLPTRENLALLTPEELAVDGVTLDPA
jgi:hypothetical protein